MNGSSKFLEYFLETCKRVSVEYGLVWNFKEYY